MSEKKKSKEAKKNASVKNHQKTGTVLNTNTVLVIGGGASGLMAAIMAARNGAKVTLLEHNDKNGKKLNATGNGKCNFTNSEWKPSYLRGEHPEFADAALSAFTVEDTLAFFEDLGLVPLEKNGYFYPKSGQAASVTALLNQEASALGVKMKSKEHVCEIRKIKAENQNGVMDSFWQAVTEGWHYEAKSVILACGSCASSIAGADGSGYELAKALGHTIITPMPALTGLKLKEKGKVFSKWAGVRFEGKVTIVSDGQIIADAAGELQLTEYGISGIPVFQVSRYAIRSLSEEKHVTVGLDFMPDLTDTEIQCMIQKRKERAPYKNIQDLFCGWMPDKLVQALSECSDFPNNLKSLTFAVKEGMPFANAQVASGGVSTTEIDEKTMESRLQKDIYFCGELIDIDGTCGGYNLQWAWSSGAAAGRSAAGKDKL